MCLISGGVSGPGEGGVSHHGHRQRLKDRLTYRRIDTVTDSLTDRETDRLIDYLTDSLIDIYACHDIPV